MLSCALLSCRSPFALPALLLACPLLFYAFLFAFGLTLEDAREAGWVSKPQPGDGEWQFWRAWSLYNFHDFPPSNIYWGAMPAQVKNEATLIDAAAAADKPSLGHEDGCCALALQVQPAEARRWQSKAYCFLCHADLL